MREGGGVKMNDVGSVNVVKGGGGSGLYGVGGGNGGVMIRRNKGKEGEGDEEINMSNSVSWSRG